jgi:hypothetical protein
MTTRGTADALVVDAVTTTNRTELRYGHLLGHSASWQPVEWRLTAAI